MCGTNLSHWSEETPEEAELIYLNLKTLKGESVDRLEDAGLLSSMPEDGIEGAHEPSKESRQVTSIGQGREVRGNPWFEEMIQGSELGRIKRRRGGETSSDGKTIIEWEVTEFENGGGELEVTSTGKRKLASLGDRDDEEMRSG